MTTTDGKANGIDGEYFGVSEKSGEIKTIGAAAVFTKLSQGNITRPRPTVTPASEMTGRINSAPIKAVSVEVRIAPATKIRNAKYEAAVEAEMAARRKYINAKPVTDCKGCISYSRCLGAVQRNYEKLGLTAYESVKTINLASTCRKLDQKIAVA
jgi:hypothetical protein